VVIAGHRVGDIKQGELPFRQPEPRHRVLCPEAGELHQLLMCGCLAGTRSLWQLLFHVLHEENTGSPVLRVNNSAVE
jgi:hypothetical protein